MSLVPLGFPPTHFTPVMNFGEVRRAQLAKSTLVTSTLVHLGSFQMLKRVWGVESNRKLLHLFIPGKTAALVPEFVVEDLPSAELQPWVPAFAVKNLPLGRTLMMTINSSCEKDTI